MKKKKAVSRKSKTSAATKAQVLSYLHGYTRTEQDRLVRQARFFEADVFGRMDPATGPRLLEVGCGVGAQTEILLEKFPNLTIEAVDASKEQIKAAEKRLAPFVRSGRVKFRVADAYHLPFESHQFDGAFICWFLEHLAEPVRALREVSRVCRPGASVYCNEVLNSTYFVDPYSPYFLQYFFQFNDLQWLNKGDPFVGAKLGNLLQEAGFREIETFPVVQHFDNRMPKQRELIIDDMESVLLSAAPALLKKKKVNRSMISGLQKEFATLRSSPWSVVYFSWVQALARVK